MIMLLVPDSMVILPPPAFRTSSHTADIDQAGAHEDCLVDEVDTETACLTCGSFSFGENWVGCSARVMVEWAFPSRRWGVDEGLTVFGSNEDARLEVDDGFSGFDCFGRGGCRALLIPICMDSRILL